MLSSDQLEKNKNSVTKNKKVMKKTNILIRRAMSLSTALVLSLATLLPLLMTQSVSAAQLTSRFIKLSDSSNGHANTTYSVGFTPTQTTAIKGIVIEFCSNSPIIGDSCTAPSGFDIVKASLPVANISNLTAGFTVDTTNSTANRAILTNGSGSTVTTTAATIDLGNGTNGVTNPTNSNTTFYARIVTYNTTGGAQAYTSATPGTHLDDGGIALSTVAQLTVTSKIQETITFCVYTNSPANCAAASGTAVTLGDANGVLANFATSYQATAGFGIASNAQSGVSVRLKGDTLCRVPGSCGSSANTVTAQGSSCTADSTTTSVEQFGLRVSVLGSGVTATAPYNCSAGNHAFDVTNTNTTYGQQIASTAGANDEVQNSIEFSAKSATTSEAGIYTSTLTFIATGTY
jgi:hypothetical protein